MTKGSTAAPSANPPMRKKGNEHTMRTSAGWLRNKACVDAAGTRPSKVRPDAKRVPMNIGFSDDKTIPNDTPRRGRTDYCSGPSSWQRKLRRAGGPSAGIAKNHPGPDRPGVSSAPNGTTSTGGRARTKGRPRLLESQQTSNIAGTRVSDSTSSIGCWETNGTRMVSIEESSERQV